MPPSPRPPILTPKHLASLRDNPRIPGGCWYFIASVTLSALNRPDEIKSVLGFALDSLDRVRAECRGSNNRSGGVWPRTRGTFNEKSPIRRGLNEHDWRHSERVAIARRTREALLKSSAVVGLPKTINALLALKVGTPAELLDEQNGASPDSGSEATTPAASPKTPAHPASDVAVNASNDGELLPTASQHASKERDMTHILTQGDTLFSTVYGKIAERVMSQLSRCGTPDLATVARVTYGYLLSGGGFSTTPSLGAGALSPEDQSGHELPSGASGVADMQGVEAQGATLGAETSLVLIAALIPQDVNPQLKGHLKGAVNCGATVEQVRGVRDVVVGICEADGMGLGRGWTEEVVTL